jgi:hypothetical protein
MKRNSVLVAGACLLGLLSSGVQATVVVGTYSFGDDELVDRVLSFRGNGMYDGSNYVNPVSSPANITDTGPISAPLTYLQTANYEGYRDVSMGLDFGQTRVINGSGADIALFFLSDQTNNEVNVAIGAQLKPLNFLDVSDDSGVQQGANGVVSDGQTYDNVRLMVAEVDLDDYGFSAGQMLTDPFSVEMIQKDFDISVSISMVGAVNTTVIPVPAAVWLFGSGLMGLIALARRKR